MKIMIKANVFTARLAGVVAIWGCAMASFGLSQSTPAMSVEQMTREADEIVHGNVVGVNTRVVANSFETDYQVQVNDNVKGKSTELQPGQTFTLTLPGGAISEPPLTQYAMGVPYMYKGEEVFLFLRQGSGKEPRLPKSAMQAGVRSNLSNSYKVIGWNQGRFTVVTREDTGEKLVTRINLENYGLLNASTDMENAVKALSQRQIPTVAKEIARTMDAAADIRSKDPLELTTNDGKQIKTEANMQKAAALKELRQRALPVQNLNDFRAQVQAFVNSY